MYRPIRLSLLILQVRGPSWINLLVERSRLCEKKKNRVKKNPVFFITICKRGESRVTSINCTATLNCGAASSLRWYWLRRCWCSVSPTSASTPCSIPRQHAWARWSKGRSGDPAWGKRRVSHVLHVFFKCLSCDAFLSFSPSVCLMMLSSSRGYLVSLCISETSKSLSCSLRHWGLASHSWTDGKHRST